MEGFKHPSRDILPSEGGRLKGRKIALALTGSIAIYQAPELARRLMRLGAEVYPVMTPRAAAMLSPELMEWATGNQPITQLTGKVENIAAVEGGLNLVLIAPATANTIAKLAHGINDNAVTGFAHAAIAAGIPVIIAPAMHRQLLANPATQESLEKLRKMGVEIVGPKFEEGKAKLASLDTIVEAVIRRLTEQTMAKLKVLVTAGPTREPLDPIRIITNRSSGRIGVCLAREAWRRGAEVTLIYGPGSVEPPEGIETVRVETSKEMFEEALKRLKTGEYHLLIAAAAMADYAPEKPSPLKISTSQFRELEVKLKATPKLVDEAKKVSPNIFLVSFKAEYGVSVEELKERALEKLKASNADLVVANDVSKPETGFGKEHIEMIVVDRLGRTIQLPKMSKAQAAEKILDLILERIRKG
ncbi:MAG: bifunctional phosphopantothenoylcysteine decarboxylase/phosphopantothenate--cysteine ligase CoaBC [Candidatus Hecatellaceae archaeon]